MKRVLLGVILFLCAAAAAHAQVYTAVSATAIKDLHGNNLPVGSICFQGTDNIGNVISYQLSGGGPVTIQPYCSPVTAGATGPFNVANPGTTTPSDIRYHIQVKQGARVIMDLPGVYLCADANACAGPFTFNFDTCFSTGACANDPLPVPAGPGGPPGAAGPTGPAGPLDTSGAPVSPNLTRFSDPTHVTNAGLWNFASFLANDIDCTGATCGVAVLSGGGAAGTLLPNLVQVTDGATTCNLTATGGVTQLCNVNATISPAGALVVTSCAGCGAGGGLSAPFSQYAAGLYRILGTGSAGSPTTGGHDDALFSIYNVAGNQFANLGTVLGNAQVQVQNNVSGWALTAQAGTDGLTVGKPLAYINRVSGFDDYLEIAPPGNPGLSADRIYMNNTTHVVSCLTHTGTDCMPGAALPLRSFGTTWGDTGGAILTAGSVVYFTVPYACTIQAWNISVDVGTATIDIWKTNSATAIPTIGNTITAAALPAIGANTHIHSTTLTAWTTSVAANDTFGFQLQTVASAHFAEIDIQCQ